ncbi:hypothetical protein [Nakamurella lactea]|uniref:hypothetical protein n=1 Tax=Nakamurella lactea TaxID=459515 RepID=UPI001B7F7B87|nr:hypothetical protein [Nakamurella lactea]
MVTILPARTSSSQDQWSTRPGALPLAVETLKGIKRKRQLIVSTHNSNVVVTSGSENIVVLEHGDSLPRIEAEGTLQRVEVKNNVCEILEGGEEAIKTRYQRLVGQLG